MDDQQEEFREIASDGKLNTEKNDEHTISKMKSECRGVEDP